MKVIIPQFSQPDNSPLAMEEKRNEFRLHLLLRDMPEDAVRGLLALKWEEVFEMAAETEVTRKSLPVSDIAWNHFIKEEGSLLKLAELLEFREKYIHKLES